jgi:hypothetical protein
VAARLSMWSVICALAFMLILAGRIPIVSTTFRSIPVLHFVNIYAIPIAGLAAAISGGVGLTRVSGAGGGKGQALAGLLGGIAIMSLAAIVIWFIWNFSHSNWQF